MMALVTMTSSSDVPAAAAADDLSASDSLRQSDMSGLSSDDWRFLRAAVMIEETISLA